MSYRLALALPCSVIDNSSQPGLGYPSIWTQLQQCSARWTVIRPSPWRNRAGDVKQFRASTCSNPAVPHDCRFKQQTQADLEAFLPPPVAAMLWEAFAYSDQYG